jgi:hypothetical protein
MLRNCVFGAYRPPATNRIDKFLKRGREWREKRDYATLDYLTTQLIDRVPYQPIPVSKIVEVMARPTRWSTVATLSFQKIRKNGPDIYLETDKQGKVTGWKLDKFS